MQQTIKVKSLSIICLLILIGSVAKLSEIHAQEIPTSTPTPFPPVLIQGNPNVGRVQPFAMSDVAVRTGIRAWQDNGWTGAGRKIGVLDRGFGGLLNFEAAFDKEVNVALGDEKAEYDQNLIIHGTQVLETLYAVAPGAELYACQYDDLDGFTVCIDWMISSKVNIINHSAGVPALPLDGSGRWAREVDRAAQANILWVNAAGNFAQGYYTDFFVDTGDTAMGSDIPNSLHEFRGNFGITEALGVKALPNGGQGVVMLSWEDFNGIPANEIDLDLIIIDAQSGEIIGSSQNQQEGYPGDQPLEYTVFDMSRDFGIQVRSANPNVPSGVRFVMFVEFARLPNGETQRSIITPGDSGNALTIGALQGSNLAPYSSRGPIETGAIKPDLAAPGEVQLLDGTQFVGTSAAAPVVAGSAALIWEAYPIYSARDVRTFLLNATQDDAEISGADINYGNGRLYLPLPAQPTETPSLTPTNTYTPTETSTPTATRTLRPTITWTPTATDTRTPRPTMTHTPKPTATRTPRPTMTRTTRPTATRTLSSSQDAGATVTVNVSSANLRNGPGTSYTTAGTASAGDTFTVVARYEDWYLIERSNRQRAWIWSGIVNLNGNDADIAIAATIPPSTVSTPSATTSSSGNLNGCPNVPPLNLGINESRQVVITGGATDAGYIVTTQPTFPFSSTVAYLSAANGGRFTYLGGYSCVRNPSANELLLFIKVRVDPGAGVYFSSNLEPLTTSVSGYLFVGGYYSDQSRWIIWAY